MKDAGITAPVPRGDWQANVNYYFLNIVNHNGISWIAKRENMGQEPSDGLYWQRFGTSVPIATTSVAGIVKPDGATISVDASGTITVKIDGESIFIDDEDNKIKASLATLVDVDVTELADGYVLAWDATSETWVAVRQSSGLLPHLIIISETGESVVKAVKGQTEVIATETSTGHYECDVPEFGTWTIHAMLGGDDAQVSLVVDTVKVYTVDDSHFHADITVTYPTGAQVSCSKSGETTLYATGSPYTFTVHSAGTWTISATLNGVTKTSYVAITTSGQSESVTIPTVPDGATVTPTDDVQTWIDCAGLFVAYSTIAEVLADTTTLLALMSDNNAVDYLVRSTTWATDICADSTAMTDIDANNYCADTLLADNTWMSAICNSAYFETVLNIKVPTMTSNTAPSGNVTASDVGTYGGSVGAYGAFDGQDSGSHQWSTSSNSAQWLKYQFGNNKHPKIYKIECKYTNGSGQTSAISFDYSDDNITWESCGVNMPNATNSQTFTESAITTNQAPCSHIRLNVSFGMTVYVAQYYGREVSQS